MIFLVGSAAAKVHDIDLGRSNVSVDVDIMGEYDDVISFIKAHNYTSIRPFDEGNKIAARVVHDEYKVIEAEVAWSNSTAKSFIDLVRADPETRYLGLTSGITIAAPSPTWLLALKLSHRYLRNSPHFYKTMQDIRMLRRYARPFTQEQLDWIKAREEVTYTYSHPKLNVSKDVFFTDDVKYEYDHDSIHENIALFEKPAYTYFLEGAVYVSKEKWDKQPEGIKLAAVYEEACVLSLERSIVPFGVKGDGRAQFAYALQKVCTSITSGWFREYAWENHDRVLAMFSTSYITRFEIANALGFVKLYKS